jgi:hypothetical protein
VITVFRQHPKTKEKQLDDLFALASSVGLQPITTDPEPATDQSMQDVRCARVFGHHCCVAARGGAHSFSHVWLLLVKTNLRWVIVPHCLTAVVFFLFFLFLPFSHLTVACH